MATQLMKLTLCWQHWLIMIPLSSLLKPLSQQRAAFSSHQPAKDRKTSKSTGEKDLSWIIPLLNIAFVRLLIMNCRCWYRDLTESTRTYMILEHLWGLSVTCVSTCRLCILRWCLTSRVGEATWRNTNKITSRCSRICHIETRLL